ncbi:MAG TPA: cytochrome P450 [Chloroflexia bacterium]|nr:cytochrome P450 [Chloroflexia bacterium]
MAGTVKEVARPLEKLPPGPPGWPFLGWRRNAIKMARDPLVFLLKLHQEYGPVVNLAQNSHKYIFAFGPALNRQILSDQNLFHNPSVKEGSMPFKSPPGSAALRLSTSMALLNGEDHKRTRRLIMPAFHKKRVEAYHNEILRLTEEHLATWRPGQTVELLQEMRRLTLLVASKALLGLDTSQAGEKTRLLLQRWIDLSFDPLTILAPYNLPGLPYHKFVKLSEEVERVLQAIIWWKRESGIDSGDVLSMLLQSKDEEGNQLENRELGGQLISLLTAGHETTAISLVWTLFLLLQHPAILAGLLDEVSSTAQGQWPTPEQLNSLKLMDNVIRESMRLFSPIPFSQRVSTAPFSLDAYELPGGTNLIYSPAVTHRLPELYPEPARFNPARWETINPSIYEYLPFGAGPRLCIGSSFAWMEMKIILTLILQKFSLQLLPNSRIDRVGFFFLEPKAMPVKLETPESFTIRKRETIGGNVRKVVDLE